MNLNRMMCLVLTALCLAQTAALAQDVTTKPNDTRAGQWREEIERQRAKQKEARRAEQEQLQKEAAEQKAARMKLLDPQLRKTWEYFEDYQNRDRDTAVRLFENYLKDNPDTPFKPEIYFRIGQLYSSHRQDADRRGDLMVKYYRLAHEGYGLKYSDLNDAAWGSVINQPSRSVTLKDRLAYYDWLSGFASASPEQMYPIYNMGIVAQCTVDSIELSEQFRQRQTENLRRELPKMLEVTAKNIVHRSNVDELRQIQKLYPDSLMAKMAASKLEAIQKLILKEAEKAIDDPKFVEPMTQKADAEIQKDVSPAAIRPTPPDHLMSQEATPIPMVDNKAVLPFWLLVIVVAILVLTIAVMVYRLKRKLKN